MKKLGLLVTTIVLVAGAVWLLLRPRAAHDPRLAGIWQDQRIEKARQAARDRGTLRGQGSWLVLDRDGQGRQIDYNSVTQQSETMFHWRTDKADGRVYFLRSYEAAGAQPGDPERSGEVRYDARISPDGKRLTLKGQYGAPAEYARIDTLPSPAVGNARSH